ncbi:hypothetical protein IQ244_02490 [Nostoc sp. LEGE 06077]|nr:hypothetical protein [Nostoc sp. LEGE 06077]
MTFAMSKELEFLAGCEFYLKLTQFPLFTPYFRPTLINLEIKSDSHSRSKLYYSLAANKKPPAFARGIYLYQHQPIPTTMRIAFVGIYCIRVDAIIA